MSYNTRKKMPRQASQSTQKKSTYRRVSHTNDKTTSNHQAVATADLWNDDPVQPQKKSSSQISYVFTDRNQAVPSSPPSDLDNLLQGYKPVKAPNKLSIQWKKSRSIAPQPLTTSSNDSKLAVSKDIEAKTDPKEATPLPDKYTNQFTPADQSTPINLPNATDQSILISTSMSTDHPTPTEWDDQTDTVPPDHKPNRSTITHQHHQLPLDSFHADCPQIMPNLTRQQIRSMTKSRLQMIVQDREKYHSEKGLDFYLVLSRRSMNRSYWYHDIVYKIKLSK